MTINWIVNFGISLLVGALVTATCGLLLYCGTKIVKFAWGA